MKTEVKTTTEITRIVWNRLMEFIGNECGVAGLMGNMYAVSNLEGNHLGNSDKLKLQMTDEEYTDDFEHHIHDKAAYGIMGWTSWISKQGLWNMARAAEKRVDDIDVQLDLVESELTSPSHEEILKGLKNAKTVREASDIVLCKYMKARNQNGAVKTKREGFGQHFYECCSVLFAPKEEIKHMASVDVKYVRVVRDNVAIRRAASILARKLVVVNRNAEFRFIVPSKNATWYSVYVNGTIGWIPGKHTELFERTESVDELGNAIGQ